MSSIELRNITKTFKGGFTALNDISFQVKDGEFFVLLGPTGAGKTTTLRIIAGLEKQTEGDVLFDGESMADVTPADRDVGFVFQQYSLYPTMTVYDNLAFPLRSPMRKLPEAEIRQQITETAEKLRITHLLQRKTSRLSGGEMQRVSLGRAIVRRPRAFLMDEPLSNLDAKLREALRIELQHLQKTEGNTTIFVTHDQIEALTMADRIAVLDHGRIVQLGKPDDIYDRPATTYVATLVGTPRINLLAARPSNGAVYIKDSELSVPTPANRSLPTEFTLGIRPEDVKLNEKGQFHGRIALTEPLGVETVVHIASGKQVLQCLVPGITHLRLGDNVDFDIAPERMHYFDPSGNRIQ
jgi:multiple sugar transport system ATP-binding protein